MSKPRVTVTCHCGERLMVPYGQRQTCSCGRTWDTSEISERDYEAVRAVARRFRHKELAFVIGAVAIVGALVYIGRSAPLIVTIPVFALAWARFFRPWWRQRKRAALRDLPTWDLTAEGGSQPS